MSILKTFQRTQFQSTYLTGVIKKIHTDSTFFILDVIINTHLKLEGIDTDIVATCAEQLNAAGLIVLKHGRPKDSIDYHDYMVSANQTEFYNRQSAKTKNKIEFIKPLISAVTEGATAVGTMMQAAAMV